MLWLLSKLVCLLDLNLAKTEQNIELVNKMLMPKVYEEDKRFALSSLKSEIQLDF